MYHLLKMGGCVLSAEDGMICVSSAEDGRIFNIC